MAATVLIRALADLVLPRACAGCGRPGEVLCGRCWPGLRPGPVRVDGVRAYAAGRYADALRAALLAYKERGRLELAGPLGALLADAVLATGPGPACLVPIPSSARARRERGGDHVLRLARHAARRCDLPVVRALRPTRRVADSAGLGRDQRAANLAGALDAVPGDGRVPVLVDDIVTTGATLREAARALLRAGWPQPVAAVVAATPRDTPGTGDCSGHPLVGGLPLV